MKVAALFVQRGGVYWNLPDVDAWDEQRDARLYDGPYPVVSHTPCPRWGKMWFGQPLWVKRTGERKIKGDDGGCFEHSLYCVRKYGGLIEHGHAALSRDVTDIMRASRHGSLPIIPKRPRSIGAKGLRVTIPQSSSAWDLSGPSAWVKSAHAAAERTARRGLERPSLSAISC